MVVCDENACIDFTKVGKRIKEIYKEKHMIQPVLLSICGCSNNHLRAIETGVNKLLIEMIMEISTTFDKSVDYFLRDAFHIRLTYLI